MRSVIFRAALTGSALLAAPALAQDAPADDVIVTAQRANATEVTRGGNLGALGDKAAEDVPFSIRSYNAALILNQQPQTLGQLLENDPSIRTTYGFGNAAEQFVIRGFVLNGEDIGLDGLFGLTPRQLVAPELYENVQVLNGASAFLFGAAPSGGAVGGTVNLIPKRAGDGDLTRITGSWTEARHFGGSFDVSRRFGSDGAFGIRINGAARRGDVAINDEFRSTYVLGGAIDYRGASVRLSLDAAYQRYKVTRLRPKVGVGGLTVLPRVPAAQYNYGQDFTYSTLRDVFGIAKAEWDVADNAMLYASFGARDGSERGIYDGITVTNATTGAATGSALFVPRTDNNEAAQAGLRVKLAAGGITHEFNLGASALWNVNRNAYDFLGFGVLAPFNNYNTNLYSTPAVPLPGTGFVGGDLDDPFPISRTRLASVFVSDTIGFADDRVLVTGGVRLQHILGKSYSYFGGGLDTRYEADALTPVIGVVVKPANGVSLFANRIEGLTQGGVAPAFDFGLSLPIINAGAIVPVTKSRQYEAGGKLTLGRVNASLAVFEITQARPAQAVAIPGNPNAAFYTRVGNQRNRGIEFSLDGEVARGLRVIAGGSILDAKLRNTAIAAQNGNEVPGVPDYLLNANVEYDLPFVRGLTLTGRVVHTGEQQVDAANTLQLPDWTRFDLGARYVLSAGERPVTLRANVDNVANRRYWTSSFDSFSPLLLQGLPRTFKLSASIDL